MKKTNLFIIGASKCATTTLWDVLNNHPDAFMSQVKEPRVFCKDNYKELLGEYELLFSDVAEEKVIGEASPTYSELNTRKIARRIYKYNPNARIIYSVRHPYTRLISVWKQTLSTGHWYKDFGYGKKMPLNFRKAVFEYPPFIHACRYWTHINNYRQFFADNQILVIYHEDLLSDNVGYLNRLFHFLGIDSNTNGLSHKNKSSEKRISIPWMYFTQRSEIVKKIYDKYPFLYIKKMIKDIDIKIPNIKDIDQKLKNKIISEISEEVALLFEYTNKPDNFWSF